MPSKREQILSALHEQLKVLEAEDIKVFRNLDKPQKIPAGGAIIILRDGDPGDPETLLSPLTYIYEHRARIEITMGEDAGDPAGNTLDGLLTVLGSLLIADRTLNGLAEWVEPQAPEMLQESIEGAPSIRAAIVQVMLRFATNDPLN